MVKQASAEALAAKLQRGEDGLGYQFFQEEWGASWSYQKFRNQMIGCLVILEFGGLFFFF
jgi:hypothetical protein